MICSIEAAMCNVVEISQHNIMFDLVNVAANKADLLSISETYEVRSYHHEIKYVCRHEYMSVTSNYRCSSKL